MGRVVSVGILLTTFFGLDDGRFAVLFPAGAEIFVFIASTPAMPPPPLHAVGSEESYAGVNSRKSETGHSPPSNVEAKNFWSYISAPLYAFMLRYLIKPKGNSV
jgi:hypothetical protein